MHFGLINQYSNTVGKISGEFLNKLETVKETLALSFKLKTNHLARDLEHISDRKVMHSKLRSKIIEIIEITEHNVESTNNKKLFSLDISRGVRQVKPIY